MTTSLSSFQAKYSLFSIVEACRLKKINNFVISKKSATFAVSKETKNIIQHIKTLWCIGKLLFLNMNKNLLKKLNELLQKQSELIEAIKKELVENNGFAYVDLELPSGTLWATMNVGARKPSDYGFYFQWGEIIGYPKNQVGIGYDFGWDDYIEKKSYKKYAAKGDVLKLEDDAANANMGGDWHMPSPVQIRELLDNTTRKWTALDDVKGMLFTSKKDGSKSIFFPAAGCVYDNSVCDERNYGYIWSSMLSEERTNSAQNLFFCFGFEHLSSGYHRNNGFSVRGVIG